MMHADRTSSVTRFEYHPSSIGYGGAIVAVAVLFGIGYFVKLSSPGPDPPAVRQPPPIAQAAATTEADTQRRLFREYIPDHIEASRFKS